MRIIGIDPGINGAVGLLDHGNVFEAVHDMPTMLRGPASKKQMVNAAELARIVRELRPDVAVIEQVGAMPRTEGPPCPVCKQSRGGMGAASSFNFGDSAGVVRGVLAALGIESHFVVPQSWKARAGLRGSDKEASRGLAIRIWPHAPLGRKKDSGRAEALLIARYGLKESAPRDYTGNPVDEPKHAAASDLRPSVLL